VRDGLAHLTHPLLAAPDIVPLPQVEDLTMCIGPFPFLHEERGEEAALRLVLELAHQGFGWAGSPAEGRQQRTEPGMRHVLRFEDGEQLGPRILDVQEESQEISLGEVRRRPSVGRGSTGRAPGRRQKPRPSPPGALELLRLDPELGGVHAEPAGGFARERRGLLGIPDLGEEERDSRVGRRPAARGGEVLLLERAIEDDGEQGPRGLDPRREGGRALGTQEAVRVMAVGENGDLDREVAGALESAGARDGPSEIGEVHGTGQHLLEPCRRYSGGGARAEPR
jgi:hypothetical protein